MERVTFGQWETWNETDGAYTLLPYIHEFRAPAGLGPLPLTWEPLWGADRPYTCLLESGKGGRYTMVGLSPASVISGKGDRAVVRSLPDGDPEERRAPPLDAVRAWMRPWRAPSLPGLPGGTGGAFGFWAYDTARSLERLPERAADDLGLPDYLFLRFEELWIADAASGAVYAAVYAQAPGGGRRMDRASLRRLYDETAQRARDMEDQWRAWLREASSAPRAERRERQLAMMAADRLEIDVERLPGLVTSMDRAAYEEAVRRIQAYIRQGDVFQVNLALRQSAPADGLAPERLYEWLRLVNPSPYMGLLRTPDFALVSASPELLVKLAGRRLSTRPIAGTRRRGRTPDEDARLEAELTASDKERAEHVMLVDLERNDLGRVAAYGTVRVPELLTVERYSHVMHLVSQVEAELAAGKDAFDVIAAVFPGGTITGAPKIRTMEIIEELEPVRRGPYTGSMGWIDYAGDMELNIIIRTIAIADGVCHIQAGAGIVIDSVPEREFYECLNKAKALWKAVQYGRRLDGKPEAAAADAPG